MGVELKPWPLAGYTPGPYSCKCLSCDKEFQGDKRATFCLECSVLSAKIEKADLRRKLDVAREAYSKAARNAEMKRGEVVLHASDWMRLGDALAAIGDDA